MRLVSFVKIFSVGVALLASQCAVQAAPITTLFNTGMSTPWDAGVQTPIAGTDPQAVAKVADSHWTVTGASTGTVGAVTMQDGVFPLVGPAGVMADLTASGDPTNASVIDSQWITSDAIPTPGGTTPYGTLPGGSYVFETTFTTPFPLVLLDISGWFKGYTHVTGIQLNSDPIVAVSNTASQLANDGRASVAAHSFNVTGTGGAVNTLRFFVNRAGPGIPALRVQFTDAQFAVPEPSTACLAMLGLAGLGAARFRRRFFGVKS